MISRLINTPQRAGAKASENVKVSCKDICNGGTWSKDPLNKASDAQLTELGFLNYRVVYSVCLARTPEEEVAEIKRYLAFGIYIPEVRLGNEEDSDIKLNTVGGNEARQFGYDAANDYWFRVQPYIEAIRAEFPQMGFILTAPYPSNQQGQRYTLFRLGWCDRVAETPLSYGVDMHVYDRCEPVPITLDLLPVFEGRERWFIEVGALYNGNGAIWLERSKRVFLMLMALCRKGDKLGIQLMENNAGTGLLMNGVLTEWGKFYESIDFRRVSKVTDKLRGIPSPYKFLILTMDNGDEVSWNGWSFNAPAEGVFYMQHN